MTGTPLRIMLTGGATELGQVVTRELAGRGHRAIGLVNHRRQAKRVSQAGGVPEVVDTADPVALGAVLRAVRPDVVLHLAPQYMNTLLSDGNAFRGMDRALLRDADALIAALQQNNGPFLVHTSFAFLYGNNLDAGEDSALVAPNLEPPFRAAVEVERQIARSHLAYCVLRTGFLYGPQSRDLRLYVLSFKLHRAYFAGPPDTLGCWVHFEDAARAIAQAAERRPAGEAINIVDREPVNFGTFIDSFARKQGYSRPGHIPRIAIPLFAWIIIKKPQRVLLGQSTIVRARKAADLLDWQPQFSAYQQGLDQTIRAWAGE